MGRTKRFSEQWCGRFCVITVDKPYGYRRRVFCSPKRYQDDTTRQSICFTGNANKQYKQIWKDSEVTEIPIEIM